MIANNSPSSIPSEAQVYGKCRHFMSSGRHDLAAKAVEDGLAHHPNSDLLHGMLAICLVNLDRYAGARESAREALKHDPECLNAFFVLARCDIEEDIFSSAELHLLEGLKIDPVNPNLLTEYARLMMVTDHLRKAQKLTEVALQIDPEDSDALSLRGLIQARRSVLTDSDEDKKRSLAGDPDSAIVQARAGSASLQAGRPFRARRYLREALRLDPSNESIEELFIEADRYCRWIGLPYYYWGLLVSRIPGRQFTVYAVLILGSGLLAESGINKNYSAIPFFLYLLFVVYTWVAEPLMKLWTRWRPPR